MKKLISILIIMLVTTQFLPAQNSSGSSNSWNNFLVRYVSEKGNVNYKDIKKNAGELEECLKSFKSDPPKSNWSENEQKAYWINVYNAFTIKLIVDNYPVKSIKDISGPWDKRFIVIDSKTYSLNDIENKILRSKYNDPRIHFAIVCAASSCPALKNKAYFPKTLDDQLNDAAINFLSDTNKNKITPSKIEISEIFTWFNADFTKKGTLIDFLNQYTKVKIEKNAKVSNITYKWNLNE